MDCPTEWDIAQQSWKKYLVKEKEGVFSISKPCRGWYARGYDLTHVYRESMPYAQSCRVSTPVRLGKGQYRLTAYDIDVPVLGRDSCS